MGKACDPIDLAYAAALDPALWQDFVAALTAHLGQRSAFFFVLDGAGEVVLDQAIGIGGSDRMSYEYAGGMHLLDPQTRHVRRLDAPAVYTDADHLDPGDAATRDYMAWHESHGYRHHLSAVAPLGEGAGKVGIAFHRTHIQGPSPKAEQGRLAALLPEMARAWRLGRQQAILLQEAYWDGIAARDAARASALIDEGGRVLRETGAMAAIFRDGKLALREGRMRCDDPQADAALAERIGRATAPVGAAGGAMLLRNRPSAAPLVLRFHPLPRRRRMLAPAEAAALVTVDDPAAFAPMDQALVRDAFALTARGGGRGTAARRPLPRIRRRRPRHQHRDRPHAPVAHPRQDGIDPAGRPGEGVGGVRVLGGALRAVISFADFRS